MDISSKLPIEYNLNNTFRGMPFSVLQLVNSQNYPFFKILLKDLTQEETMCVPRGHVRPAGHVRPTKAHFKVTNFALNLARGTSIKAQCGLRMKIVSHPWPNTSLIKSEINKITGLSKLIKFVCNILNIVNTQIERST